jgi:hypothetical protein
MNERLKSSAMLEEMIAQLKIYMGRFEKKGMQTDVIPRGRPEAGFI